MRYIQDRIDPAFTIIRRDALAYPRIGYTTDLHLFWSIW